MKTKAKLCAVLFALLAATGCWDTKTIQSLAYITAIGLDYKDGRYTAYMQVLNFSNVARSDKLEIGKSVPVWLGKGEGTTVVDALTSIYETSQIRAYWGHIKAVVCTESILKDKKALRLAYDTIDRYHEVRYNILLYGTKEKFADILTQKSLLNLSPLDTIMDSPEENFKQHSSIQPQYGYRNIAELNEKGRTIILPTLAITDEQWLKDRTKKPMMKIDGAFAMQEHRLKGWFSEEDLRGIRWFNKRAKRIRINIPDDVHPEGSLMMMSPRHKIRIVRNQGDTRFDVRVKIRASVEGMSENVSIEKMERQAEEVVRKEIRSAYLKGLSSQTDLLNLRGEVYRNDPRLWNRLAAQGGLTLKENTLNRIDVKVRILHTGKYKGRVLPD